MDGRPFYVRQMKNRKDSMPIEWLVGEPFNEYVLGCGAILARAHARTGDAAKIASYCGKTKLLTKLWPLSRKPMAIRPSRTTQGWWRRSRPIKLLPSKVCNAHVTTTAPSCKASTFPAGLITAARQLQRQRF
jgi:Uncharacterized protein conserved in bacteria (DUF2252)